MYKVDYHHHSKFSFDGKDFLEDICKKAIEIDLNEICFVALSHRTYVQKIVSEREEI